MSDDSVRKRITEDLDSNFFVEAGAGSGKTRALVDRMAAMVESGKDISEICAITFTKAAANEFYSRFQNKLSESHSEAADAALKNIDMCFMGTIDSFCNMIMSEHPVEAKIPASSAVLSEKDLEQEYLNELGRIARGEYGRDLEEKYKTAHALTGNKTAKVFVEVLKIVMSMRNVELHKVESAQGSVDEILASDIERVRRLVEHLYTNRYAMESLKSDDKSRKAWDAVEECCRVVNDRWHDNLFSVISKLKSIGKIRINLEYDMDQLGPGWDKLFKEGMYYGKPGFYVFIDDKNPLMIADKLNSIKYSAAMDLVTGSAKLIADRLRAQGKLSFSDYLLYFRDLLKNDIRSGGRLIKHISRKHKYYLIDEFQDTDPLQAEIFYYLSSEEDSLNEDWKKCRPRPGSLFVVGDPKQSIYRFRNADIQSYKRVQNLFDGDRGEVLVLTENRRSDPVLCDWFNTVFTQTLVESENQSGFHEIPSAPADHGDNELCGVYKYNSGKDDSGIISSIITAVTDNDRFMIKDGKGGIRRIRYDDFMVLTYTTAGISRHMREFKNMGIPFNAAGDVLFKDCPALVSAAYLMKYIARRFAGDKMAEFRAKYLSSVDLDMDKVPDNMTAAALFSWLLDKQQILIKAGTDNIEYLYYAQELLRAREIDGTVDSVDAGADYLLGLIQNGKKETERVLRLSDEEGVSISNLHKVKGLEKNIVILSNPNSTPKDPSFRRTLTDGFIFNVSERKENDRTGSSQNYALIETAAFDAEKEKEAEALDAEKARLLYVAATRAQNVLLIASKPTKDGIEAKGNPWSSLLEFVDKDFIATYKTALTASSGTDDGKTAGDADKTADVNTDQNTKPLSEESCRSLYSKAEAACSIKSKRETYEISLPSTKKSEADPDKNPGGSNKPDDQVAQNPATVESESGKDEKTEMTEKSEKSRKGNAAVMGTMVHRYMELLVTSKGKISDETAIRSIIEENRDDLSCGVRYEEELGKVARTIRAGGYEKQEPGVPADILAELLNAEEVYCELPFCCREEPPAAASGQAGKASAKAVICNGVMDLVYRKDGKWHILDYKTNYENDNLGDKYNEQLSEYVKAFRQITGETADARIYSIPV